MDLIVSALLFRIISVILNEIEGSIERSSLLEDIRMTELLNLQAKFIELLELLVIVANILQKIILLSLVMLDFVINNSSRFVTNKML